MRILSANRGLKGQLSIAHGRADTARGGSAMGYGELPRWGAVYGHYLGLLLIILKIVSVVSAEVSVVSVWVSVVVSVVLV